MHTKQIIYEFEGNTPYHKMIPQLCGLHESARALVTLVLPDVVMQHLVLPQLCTIFKATRTALTLQQRERLAAVRSSVLT